MIQNDSHKAHLFKTFNQRPVIKILKINDKFSHPFAVLSYTSSCEYPGFSYSGTVNNVPLSDEAFSSGPFRQLLEVPHPGVDGLNVINDPKCNKVLNVITFCAKCNYILSKM